MKPGDEVVLKADLAEFEQLSQSGRDNKDRPAISKTPRVFRVVSGGPELVLERDAGLGSKQSCVVDRDAVVLVSDLAHPSDVPDDTGGES